MAFPQTAATDPETGHNLAAPVSVEGSRLMRWFHKNGKDHQPHRFPQLPTICATRRDESLQDTPLDLSTLTDAVKADVRIAQETVLYLGYGSNMSIETFRGRRGIKPLAQTNVVVPTLSLAFNLPGAPYYEPCFANSRVRQSGPPSQTSPAETLHGADYHKDRWHKGLVGVVYEVTKKDYAKIIATEGGGASYQDVVVDCFALSEDDSVLVPDVPTDGSFRTHTLFAPGRKLRPDPDYAQPSARYLKLLTDGADELGLPKEYKTYLHNIRSYRITSNKQRLGLFVTNLLWSPIIFFIFSGSKIFQDKNGRSPPWYANLVNAIFTAVWASYDSFFKPMFGDGERTDGETDHDESEKVPLLVHKDSLPLTEKDAIR